MPSFPTIPIDFDVINDIPITLAVPAPINLGLTLSPIEIKPLEIELKPLHVTLAPIEVRPIDFTLRIKEVPSVRVRFPMDYKVCFNLLGHEVGSVRLCGQGQVITEPYYPNPCECRPAVIRANAIVAHDDVEAVPAA